ncbi:hypothetical protein GIB67_043199, partial [Kingdonia uniflora]
LKNMEFLFLYMFLLVILFVFLPLKLFTYKQKSQSINLPLGKTGWPIIGESLDFVSARRKGTPEKFINDRMRAFSPEIFKTSLLGEPTAVFCNPAGNKFLFSNENKLVHSWWPSTINKIFPSGQHSSSKEEAKKLRRMLPGFFKPESLQRYVHIMDLMAKEHLETSWDNNKEVVVLPLAKNLTFSLACKLFLSINDPVHVAKFLEPFSKLAHGIMSIPIDLPGTDFNTAIKASNTIRKEILSIMKQRKVDLAEKKASPTQDILSYMLVTTNEDGEYMDDLGIIDKILALLIGGHDTVSSAITSIVKYLAELPHVYNEVLREQTEIANSKKAGELLNWEDIQKMKYSWNVACEALRLDPPVQGSFREALTDFTYLGFSIPKGWKLYWTNSSTHKNPDYFPDPQKFDPSRFEGNGPAPYTFVPFGGGPRMCPGKEYARLEILAFMHHVVRKYKWKKVYPKISTKELQVRLHPQKMIT